MKRPLRVVVIITIVAFALAGLGFHNHWKAGLPKRIDRHRDRLAFAETEIPLGKFSTFDEAIAALNKASHNIDPTLEQPQFVPLPPGMPFRKAPSFSGRILFSPNEETERAYKYERDPPERSLLGQAERIANSFEKNLGVVDGKVFILPTPGSLQPLVQKEYRLPPGFIPPGTTATDFLTANGIIFPEGCFARYDAKRSTLVVLNTREQIELIDTLGGTDSPPLSWYEWIRYEWYMFLDRLGW